MHKLNQTSPISLQQRFLFQSYYVSNIKVKKHFSKNVKAIDGNDLKVSFKYQISYTTKSSTIILKQSTVFA